MHVAICVRGDVPSITVQISSSRRMLALHACGWPLQLSAGAGWRSRPAVKMVAAIYEGRFSGTLDSALSGKTAGSRSTSGSGAGGSRGQQLPAAKSGSAAAPPARTSHDPESPVIVLAGFFVQELATIRQLLDSIGGEEVRVIPTTPALLHRPAVDALQTREINWDEPVPSDWVQGGGWGPQRMALISGIQQQGIDIMLAMFAEAGMEAIVTVVATTDNARVVLGELLAGALKQHRQGRGSRPAEDAPPAAFPNRFVDELPPVDQVIPEEVYQPSSSVSPSTPEPGRTAGPRVVAEFEDVAPRQAARSSKEGQAGPEARTRLAAGVDEVSDDELGIIDSLASDTSLDAMDTEELLEAARQALGLDDAKLQRLVDDAAAQAAAALNVPFMPSGAAVSTTPDTPSAPPAVPTPPPQAQPTQPASRMPWDARSAQQPSQPKGFQPAINLQRRGIRNRNSGRPNRSPASSGDQSATAPATSSGGSEPASDGSPKPISRQPVAERSKTVQDRTSGEIGGKASSGSATTGAEQRPLPPVDQFVLSKSQLKAATEKHGLDFEEVVTGLAERGIYFSD